MLFIEKRGDLKLYAKSGWMSHEPQVGWYTGWVEDAHGKITAFSLNMQMYPSSDLTERKQLTLSILDKLNLLKLYIYQLLQQLLLEIPPFRIQYHPHIQAVSYHFAL